MKKLEGVYVADSLENVGEYAKLGPGFGKAIAFLQRKDLKSLPNGRYSLDGENVYEADLTGAVAIVIGAEGEGVSQLVLKNCDKTLSIPMKGHINSLNASVAAGIMLFQASRARNG